MDAANFNSVCAGIKLKNASIHLPRYDAIKFSKSPDLLTPPLEDDQISEYCNENCYAILYSTQKPILITYDASTYEKDFGYINKPFYIKNLTASGTYALILASSPKCNLLGLDIIRGNYKDVRNEDIGKCVKITAADKYVHVLNILVDKTKYFYDQKRKVDFAEFYKIYVNADTLSLDGVNIGSLDNAYYNYPPGPSSRYCLSMTDHTASLVKLLSPIKL